MLLNLQAAQTLDIVAIVVGPKSIFKKNVWQIFIFY